ncbi:MAG TPA: hypothetical protein VFJ17_10540 [Mycobacteriales bacterium]|jgi:hypothetical protein|nr:hypothetical protein [Mycobacteriales bacterium]
MAVTGSTHHQSRASRILTTAGAGASALVLALGPSASALAASGGGHGPGEGHNPPGNNGTVKIHDVAGDTSQHDVPHVSCDFYVDFWGFDSGQTMTVSFAGQAPTGKDVPLQFTASDGYSITSPDAAGGGNDFDGELGFSASADQLAALGDPQPQQGYHVTLTVSTGQPDQHPNVKHKVFWLQPCETTGGGGDTGGGDTGGGDTGGGDTGGQTPGSHAGGVHHRGSTSGTATHVLGEHIARSPHQPAEALGTSATLPFTGSHEGSLTLAAAACIAAGIGLTAAGRRRPSSARR